MGGPGLESDAPAQRSDLRSSSTTFNPHLKRSRRALSVQKMLLSEATELSVPDMSASDICLRQMIYESWRPLRFRRFCGRLCCSLGSRCRHRLLNLFSFVILGLRGERSSSRRPSLFSVFSTLRSPLLVLRVFRVELDPRKTSSTILVDSVYQIRLVGRPTLATNRYRTHCFWPSGIEGFVVARQSYEAALPAYGTCAEAMLRLAVGPLLKNLDLPVHAHLAGAGVVWQAGHDKQLHGGSKVGREIRVPMLILLRPSCQLLHQISSTSCGRHLWGHFERRIARINFRIGVPRCQQLLLLL